MSGWIILILLPSVFALGHPRYECGENGRFEYCIDGIPGCIIGCHCHPGYYFDTETKICEPNAKLVEEYRRLYVAEPTRVAFTPSPALSESGLTPTTTTPSGPNSVTRDTDDLGDWLYNQFFKTIETEVMNNTDKNSNILTRRTGSDHFHIKKPKIKKRRKKSKNSSRKAKKKNDDLRRKLLRISEDDSIFDSSSSSDSSDSSSSSESSSGEKDRENKQDDKEKTHRKFILMNKKPRMPLPSFIFMPNYQTPFYPPIGLPAPPPAFPMYPMVPVPPMMPSFPHPVPPPCETTATGEDKIDPVTESTTKPSDVHTKKDDDSIEKNHKKDKKDEKNEKDEKDEKDEKEEKKEKEDEFKIEDSKKEEEETAVDDQEKLSEDNAEKPADGNRKKLIRNRNKNNGKRKKILQQLRERMRPQRLQLNMNTPMKKKKKVLRNHFINMDTEPVRTFTDDYNLLEPYMFNEPTEIPVDEPLVPGGDDVNFKYLAQLIHRADPGLLNSKDITKNKINAMEHPEFEMGEKFQPFPQNLPTRRNNGNRYLVRPNEPDDSYYSNLGLQIASLIRRLDSTGQREVDIELNRKPDVPSQPVFNENNYAARSYWERSVRSPLNSGQMDTDEDYPQTNYQNLYNLENKFEMFATTERTLSLNDLENVVFLMNRAKESLQHKSEDTKNTKKSKGNFNVSLLPRQKERIVNFRKNYNMKDRIDRNNVKPKNKTNITKENNSIHLNPYLNGDPMNNFKPVLPEIKAQDLLISNLRFVNNLNLMSPRNQNQTNIKIKNILPQKINFSLQRRNYSDQPRDTSKLSPMHAQLPRNPDTYMYPMKKLQSIFHQLNPLQKISHKNTKYYTDKNKNYMYEKESIPFHLSIDGHNLKPTKPSYFHHEFHHFDYFD